MECYKAGLDVKDESITKDRSKCSFKQKHLIFNSDGNKVIGVGE
tara:strand:- start:1426 stop:1557 length:132 start_codon:yes stop_codon:yes gene_type:complete